MLSSIYTPAKQAGNGVIVAFGFSFKILAATDLVVSKIDQNGLVTIGVLGVDYTVTFDPVMETGTVTYTVAPVSGGFSLIQRVSNNQQQSSLPREGNAPAKVTETMIDKVTALVQELQTSLALIQVLGSPIQTGTFAALSAIAALNPTVPFAAVVTDSKTFQVYTGNTLFGSAGWWIIGGGA